MTLPEEYFAKLYADSADPWGFRTRWYEQRKRDVTTAVLTKPSYRRAFEPGCSIGVQTRQLASRCQELVATDVDERAVAAATAAVRDLAHVAVSRLGVPDEWPDGTFDLVVVSEMGYYLSADALERLFDRVLASLEPAGTLLLCHWRHAVADYPLSAAEVHAAARAREALVPAVQVADADFLLDVLTNGPVDSPAARDGLVNPVTER